MFDLAEERRGLGEIDVKYLGPHVNEKVGKALLNEIFPLLIVSDPQTGNLRVFDYNGVGRVLEFWLGSRESKESCNSVDDCHIGR